MKHTRTEWHKIKTKDGVMRLFVARPDHGEIAPCVIVFQEAFGLNNHIQDVVRRIASLGFVTVAPELFHRTAPGFEGDYENLSKSAPHMDALTNAKLEEDIRSTCGWLVSDGQTDSVDMACVGFCMGGKATFIANAIVPLRAAVSFYGSSIPSLLQDYAGRQQAPLLLLWGGLDEHIDATKRAEISEALRIEGKQFTNSEFSKAGHGFFCDARKTYNADAAQEAWALLAVFLKTRLHGMKYYIPPQTPEEKSAEAKKTA